MTITCTEGHKASISTSENRWDGIKAILKDITFILKLNILLGVFIFWQVFAYIPD
jgi:hypothetical protein